MALAVGPDRLYFHTMGDGALARVGFDGASLEQLATGFTGQATPSDMVFVGATLHWFALSGEIRIPSGPITTLGPGGSRLATDGTHLVAAAGATGAASLYVVDVASGAHEAVATGLDEVGGVAVGGGMAFAADAAKGQIVAAPIDGSVPAKIISTGEAAPWAIASDGQHLYWVNHGADDYAICTPGAVLRAKLDGTERTQLGDVECPVALALDVAHVFVVSKGSTGKPDGAVYRVGK